MQTIFLMVASAALASAQRGQPDSDAQPNHSPSGDATTVPAIDDDTEISIQTCNLTHGYYMDPDDDHWTLPDFSEQLGIANVPCAPGDQGVENCTHDPDTCDSGQTCARYNDTDSNMTSLENNQTGRCFPCELGQTCPAGTVTKAYSIFENRCPPGKICETPAKDVKDCPNGTFCPRGTFHKGMDGDTECKSPGMYCPNGTKKDEWWCPNGTYCPTVYDSYICPKGSFCWEGSHQPMSCGQPSDITFFLSSQLCPEGTNEKPSSFEGLFVLAILVASILSILGIVRCSRHFWVCVAAKCHCVQALEMPERANRLAQKLGGHADAETSNGKAGVAAPAAHQRSFPMRPGIEFTYKDLTLTVNAAGKPKVVVDHVSGAVPAATMTAVMGPSGAGKTSFMNVLCDRAGYGTTSGHLTLNGTPDRISNHRDIMGFVPQDDIVHDDLTVRENLMYAAMIRLPIEKAAAGCRTFSICRPTKRQYYKNYVDEVLDMLQIGHVQHSIVGSVEKRGISGGQRKRVNIGLELVADPDVLFLDEPTSGLDSTSAEIILAALKDLSRLGRTIIMVIHQPRYSIFASMDNVIFLGPGGKTVYSGSPIDATDYFEMLGFHAPPGVNRADYFMDVIGGTVSRANEPDFEPSHLFELWKDWVLYSDSPSFQLKADDAAQDSNWYVENDACVFRPKELQILKTLFVEALVKCRATSSTALTNENELKTFLLMVSEASVNEKIATRQALALGLVVRQAFYGDTKSLIIASSSVKMSNLESNLKTNSVRGTSSGFSNQRSDQRKLLNVQKTRTTMDIQMVDVPIVGEHKTDDVESGSRSLGPTPSFDNLESFQVNGILEWSDLAFTLNRADVMANLLRIRSLEIIGTDVETLTAKTATADNDASPRALVSRQFGWDHKIAQLMLFSIRYVQKRERGIKDWYMDCVLLLGGAAVMGIIVGPTTKNSMVDTGSMLLNHLMIVMVYGTLATISSLPTFAQSKLMFWRESSQDVSILAIWCSRNCIDIVFVLLQTLGFVAVVYDMTNPLMNLTTYYYIYVAIGYANSGLGYFLSTFIPRRNLTLYSALLAVLIGAFFSGTLPYLFELQESIIKGTSNTAATKLAITKISYSRWSVEALVVTEIMMAPPGIVYVYGVSTFEEAGYACTDEMYYNDTIESYEKPFERLSKDFLMPDTKARVPGQALLSNLWPLFWIGTVLRVAALLGLYIFDRKQQNKTAFMELVWGVLCRCCSSKNKHNTKEKSHLTLKEMKEFTTNPKSFEPQKSLELTNNPSFGHVMPNFNTTSKTNMRLRSMYLQAINCAATSTVEEGWLERVEGHGPSSKLRQQQLKSKMGMLFDIWDKIGDGILDEADMKGITKTLQKKVFAQFGNKESRQRLKNVGFVTPQTFSQFFEWFVVQPTVDKIFETVQKSNPKKTKKEFRQRKRQSIMNQFSRTRVSTHADSESDQVVRRRRGRSSVHPKTAFENRRRSRKRTSAEAKNTEKEEKPSKQGRQKEIKRQSTVYEPTFEKLPKGWTEFFDIEKGAPYYFNHNTQVTCWERPV